MKMTQGGPASVAAALLGGAALLAACGGSGGTATTAGAGGKGSSSASSGAKASASAGTGGTTSTATTASSGTGGTAPAPKTKIILILMENHNWADLKVSASAPYIQSLLPMGAHAEQYYNPALIHPSEPNYIWLEAGTNFGVNNDDDPSANSQTSTAHLVNQLEAAGFTWKAYEEDIDGTTCPLTGSGNFAPRHCPMLFFQDVTNDNSTTAPRCIAHVRPYGELATDLAADMLPDYSFITPNLCDDMHTACAPLNDQVKQGDTWLSQEVPKLLASKAYTDGAIILITWDEGVLSDGPIGMIALSKTAKVGYSNTIKYTHSSTVRTVEANFGLSPFLGDAATATDLADLFTTPP